MWKILILVLLAFSALVDAGCDCSCKQCSCKCEEEGQCVLRLGSEANPASSCAEIKEENSDAVCGNYFLKDAEGQKFKSYCQLENIEECGEGPWNLVMRTDGTKDTFKYNYKIWTSKTTLNEEGGEEGIAGDSETKLAAYWTVPVKKICLGMKTGEKTKWIAIPLQEGSMGKSLHELVSSGEYTKTTLGRDSWKSLIDDSSLQSNCNQEGINTKTRWIQVRFGIIGNQEKDCNTPDSYLGIGTSSAVSTGNYGSGTYGSDNGEKSHKSVGIILVQ